MSIAVLVTMVDADHLQYVQNFFTLAKKNAKWAGDFAVIVHDVENDNKILAKLQNQNVKIFHADPLTNENYLGWGPATLAYFYVFSEFFLQWKNIVYCDIDVTFRGRLDQLAGVQGFYASSFYHRNRGQQPIKILQKFLQPRDLFIDSVMAFSTSCITKTTFSELITLYNAIDKQATQKKCSIGIDEIVLSYFFKNKKKELHLKYHVIPNDLMFMYGVKPRHIGGIIIHHAAGNYYPKPWHSESPFFKEWLGQRTPKRIIKFYIVLWIKQTVCSLDRVIGKIGILLNAISPSLYKILKSLLGK